MFIEELGLADNPLGIFFYLTVSGYAFYFAVAALSYFAMFRWRARPFNRDYRPTPDEDRRAKRLAFYSIAGNAVLMVPINILIANGYSQTYYDVGRYGWLYLIFSALFMFAITETLVYWAHRILHMGFMYRVLHRHHHAFHRPNSWVATAFHPLDSFLQALPHHLCVFLFPLHANVYTASVMLVMIWSVSIHDRVSLLRGGTVNHAEHHTMHHWFYDFNYGQYTTFWDRICGTYRSPNDARLWPPRDAAEVAERRYNPMLGGERA